MSLKSIRVFYLRSHWIKEFLEPMLADLLKWEPFSPAMLLYYSLVEMLELYSCIMSRS